MSFSRDVFKYRSYTPIPFIILMLVFENANVYSLSIGLLITLIGEAIRLWAVSWAGSETRTTGTIGGTFLIISGPYSFVRNPLYVGNILMYTGLGIMSNALFPYLQIAGFIFFVIQYLIIINEEEKYLSKTFGAEFENFKSKVPKFLPRLIPYRDKNVKQPPLNMQAGLKSERRSIQAFAVVAFLVLIKWLIRTQAF